MPSQTLYPNESDLEVLRQRFLLRKFFSSPCFPFSTEEVSFFVFELFQNYSAIKDYLAPEDEYCFLLLLLQAIVIIMGIALINAIAKAKSVIDSLCNHIALMGHRGRQLIDDLTCFVF